MCGIAGIMNLDHRPVALAQLRHMTEALAHRGPDGDGHWLAGHVALGHRRLAIIDLTAAAQQPMASADARFVLSYNGEVYNYRELRHELEILGYRFRSASDTEVVLYALAHWGERALARFNGMFALALWDQQERRLLLARDRYGVKPLYYAVQNRTFVFASEQKALCALPDFQRRLDAAALLEYFTFQNIFTDRTLLRGVHMFPAGHYGVLDLATPQPELRLTRYWDFHFEEPDQLVSYEACVEELDRLFLQAVRRQTVADVELGSYLSGGMDSGSITALAAQTHPYLKTFTCGFDLSSASGIEMAYDERGRAEAMSARFKTEHYEIVLKAGDMERILPHLVRHLEEPRVGQSYPNYYVAQLARRFVKVVFSGTGGDELFGGYPWRYYRAASCNGFEDYIDQYYAFWQRLIPNSAIQKVFAPIWPEVREVWTRDIFRDVFNNHDNRLERPEDYINHSLYFEAKTFLHGLLVVEDKLSMAHGLETRVPFLDNDLVDFAMRCPVAMKLRHLEVVAMINENEATNKKERYFRQTNDGKQILRAMMQRYIPASVTGAVKQGFSAPDASWFRGASMDYVRCTLLDGTPHLYDYMDRAAVAALIEEHMQGQQNRRLFIWSLLYFEEYLRNFMH